LRHVLQTLGYQGRVQLLEFGADLLALALFMNLIQCKSKDIHKSVQERHKCLTKDLELTAEQQRQVNPLLEEHHGQIQALAPPN
jgi:hypothetical protein